MGKEGERDMMDFEDNLEEYEDFSDETEDFSAVDDTAEETLEEWQSVSC